MRYRKRKSLDESAIELNKSFFERFVSEFMFVPIFVIVLWLFVFSVHCICTFCYNESAVVYVCEPQAIQNKAGLVNGTENSIPYEKRIDGKININSATASQLETLNGIGSVKAENIIKAREKMGGFRTVEDLLNVDGVGENILEQIREYLVFE